MAIDLRNLKEKVISNKGKEKVSSNIAGIKKSETNETTNIQFQSLKNYSSKIIQKEKFSDEKNFIKQKSDIISDQTQNYKLPKPQWILLIYTTIFIAILSVVVNIDWTNIWQLSKSIVFIFGVSGFLILASILWIFGGIKHIVKINLGDILLVSLGFSIVIVSILNSNQIAFWGSIARIFDAGIFVGFLTLFYILLKIFLDRNTFNILLMFSVIIFLIGLLIGGLAIYIPNFTALIPILNKLNPTNTWLTESPQELLFISLLVFNTIFLVFYKRSSKNILTKVLLSLYYLAVFIHSLLLIRLPSYIMYILTILVLLVNCIIYINKSVKENININNRIIVIRLSFVYGVIGIVLVAMSIIRPFQNNVKFPEYSSLSVPNIKTTVSITKQSLQSDTWFGSGNIMYAWNKFTPSVNETQILDFSFETLYNEISNIVVRNGLVVSVLIITFAIWILGTLIRLVFNKKTVPVETYTLIIAIIGLFIIPFTVITKVLFILILLLWSNIMSKYFNPIINLNLDINKIPSSISSLVTFIILFSIATTLFVSTKFYNILKSQEYVVKASQVQNNLSEQVNLLAEATNKSSNIIEYAHLYIPSLINQITQEAIDLSNSTQNSENKNIDNEKQSNLQRKIELTQSRIDDYKKNFPSDIRVIYWKLDLYSIIQKYGIIDENEYLSLVSKGRELQKNSLYWDIYEAQYYARKAQKEQKVNMEQLDKAKIILKSLIEKNIYFVQAYQNYYDILSIQKEYTEQISILNKYVNAIIDKDLIADQNLVYNLALAYQNNKQYDEAISYYNKLIESFPNYTNLYFNLGEIYEAQKKNDLAIQKYQKVLELDPTAEIVRKKLEQLK